MDRLIPFPSIIRLYVENCWYIFSVFTYKYVGTSEKKLISSSILLFFCMQGHPWFHKLFPFWEVKISSHVRIRLELFLWYLSFVFYENWILVSGGRNTIWFPYWAQMKQILKPLETINWQILNRYEVLFCERSSKSMAERANCKQFF